MNITTIKAIDLPDAWFQCVYNIFNPVNSRKRKIDKGSYEGEIRLEYDYITVHIKDPGHRPLIPEIPARLGIPNPVESMEYVEDYFVNYLMGSIKSEGEQYTYGERVALSLNTVISRYKESGHGNNQLILQVGAPEDIHLNDPPCLRHIDTRISDGKLHFIIYFRSWDLWGGFPANLAGMQLLKEYMAQEIGVDDGEMICSSKGLHLYKYVWKLAALRTGKNIEEIRYAAE